MAKVRSLPINIGISVGGRHIAAKEDIGVSFALAQPCRGSTRERRNPELYPKRNVSSNVMCHTNETENDHSTHRSRSRFERPYHERSHLDHPNS